MVSLVATAKVPARCPPEIFCEIAKNHATTIREFDILYTMHLEYKDSFKRITW